MDHHRSAAADAAALRGMTHAGRGAGWPITVVLVMVETGQRPLDRRSHIAALAGALKVSETDLVGGPHLSPTGHSLTRMR